MADEWDDRLAIHREANGDEYLVVELGKKWWDSVEQTHLFVVPLERIKERMAEHTAERSAVDALLKSALGEH